MRKPTQAWMLAACVAAVLFAPAGKASEPEGGGPTASLARLKAGNEKFVADPSAALPVDEARRQAATKGQSPFAIVLSCADSRVPPETIFNAGLGEVFVVRTAGQAVDKAVLASLEYAVEHLHAPLLVVMGHESCGAVKASLEAKPGGASMGPNLDYLVRNIRPAFDRLTTPADLEHIREAILANVEQVVNDLVDRSDVLRGAMQHGHVQVVGAYYELATGRVRFSAPVAPPAAHATASAH